VRFWAPWGVAATVAAVCLYFFLVGLADGSVSSFNAGLWTVLLLLVATVTGGSLWLKSAGRPGLGALLAPGAGRPRRPRRAVPAADPDHPPALELSRPDIAPPQGQRLPCSRAPNWLSDLGYPRPPPTNVDSQRIH
jgi:hypothetical protein